MATVILLPAGLATALGIRLPIPSIAPILGTGSDLDSGSSAESNHSATPPLLETTVTPQPPQVLAEGAELVRSGRWVRNSPDLPAVGFKLSKVGPNSSGLQIDLELGKVNIVDIPTPEVPGFDVVVEEHVGNGRITIRPELQENGKGIPGIGGVIIVEFFVPELGTLQRGYEFGTNSEGQVGWRTQDLESAPLRSTSVAPTQEQNFN